MCFAYIRRQCLPRTGYGGRSRRSWSAVARRKAARILGQRKGNPWTDQPVDPQTLDDDEAQGNALRPTLDRKRRLREKLVVILSEACIENEWIGEEVEAALQEESYEDRLVVLPVRLDDAVMEAR